MDFDPAALREGLLYFIILVCSLALHEWGHAFTADRLGDDTPRSEGRVTLNPLVHIDLIGTILIPALSALGVFGGFAMIGWAKPVYTNPNNFRRGQFDQALVTIAGPGINFLLALLATVASALAIRFAPDLRLHELMDIVVFVNVALLVFNLLPIPPLDGSKFLMYWFGMSQENYMRLSSFGGFILLLLINLPPFRRFVGMLIATTYGGFESLHRVLVSALY